MEWYGWWKEKKRKGKGKEFQVEELVVEVLVVLFHFFSLPFIFSL